MGALPGTISVDIVVARSDIGLTFVCGRDAEIGRLIRAGEEAT